MINKQETEIKTKIFDMNLIRFIFVGGINTLFGNLIMFGLYNFFGASRDFSMIMNYILGSVLSFFLNKYFTFRNKVISIRQVFLFISNIILCYIFAYGMAKFFINSRFMNLIFGVDLEKKIKLKDNVFMVVNMFFFTGLNYFGQRFIVFNNN